MDSGFRTPLIDFFRRGEVARDVRLLAAAGVLAPRAHEQVALLILLADDADAAVASSAAATLHALPLSSLPIIERMKLAMKGSKSQRAQLIRDSNKLVAAAVLSSPKLTESEVEAFTKMANVTEEVLRTIAMNRAWVKNYGVIAGLTRNPKTPPAISM